jgi:hypothetical protein
LRGSTHVYAVDLIDEGFGRVLDTVRERGGLDGVVLAATYHHAFDILPHNPVRRVHYHEGGAAYFRPDSRRYEGLRIKPIVSRFASDLDPLGQLMDEAGRRGMAVRTWTNHMQETDQGLRHPDTVVRNAFGDPYERWLCPANPDVRAYVAAISSDIARYGVETLMLESMCYQPWDIIFSAGRTHYPYSPIARWLLSLCFCDHCLAAAQAAGVRGGELRRFVRDELTGILAGERSVLEDIPFEPDQVGALAGGEMGAFMDVRRAVVESFVAETVDAVRRGSSARVAAFDWSGGLVGYAAGGASGRVSYHRAWQDGFDPATIAGLCDGLAILAYTRDLDQFRTDLAGYRAVIPPDRSLSVAMRPMTPDCHSIDELRAKVDVARALDIDWLEFYHYGLMRLANLDWVGKALKG